MCITLREGQLGLNKYPPHPTPHPLNAEPQQQKLAKILMSGECCTFWDTHPLVTWCAFSRLKRHQWSFFIQNKAPISASIAYLTHICSWLIVRNSSCLKHVICCPLDLHFMMVFCSLRCVWKGPGVEHQTCDIIGNTCIYPAASCQNGGCEKDRGMCCKSQQWANKIGEDDQTSSIHFPAFVNYICLCKELLGAY